MIEFYAPWCSACIHFSGTYAKLAHTIHATNSERKRPIYVAKVNGDKERASTSRFNIQSYPTIFVVDGWHVYQFVGSRSEDALMKFVLREGYKDQHVRCFVQMIHYDVHCATLFSKPSLLENNLTCVVPPSSSSSFTASSYLVIPHGSPRSSPSTRFLYWTNLFWILQLFGGNQRIYTSHGSLHICLWGHVHRPRHHDYHRHCIKWKDEGRLIEEERECAI